MPLTAEAVHNIFMDCLYTDEELQGLPKGVIPESTIQVKGIIHNVGFHGKRLESHREEILELIGELPEDLDKGLSFLALCVDKNNHQWGEHLSMEQLVQLGIGIGKLRYCLPQALWGLLPGHMPYIELVTE